MEPLSLTIALIAGLTASAHCVVMCGSVICSFSPTPKRQLTFHLGRVAGYALAGAVVGTFGAAVSRVAPSNIQWTLRALTGIIGVLVGLHTAGVLTVFTRFEKLTKTWFSSVTPRISALNRLQKSSRFAAHLSVGLGLLWSMVPCGMVYAALALAALAGSTVNGAATMLAFGIGTTPALLAFGWLTHKMTHSRTAQLNARVRVGLGLLIALLSLSQAIVALHNGGWFGAQYLVYWDHPSTCAPR